MQQTSMKNSTQWVSYRDAHSQQNLEKNNDVSVEDNDASFSVCLSSDIIYNMDPSFNIPSIFSCTIEFFFK